MNFDLSEIQESVMEALYSIHVKIQSLSEPMLRWTEDFPWLAWLLPYRVYIPYVVLLLLFLMLIGMVRGLKLKKSPKKQPKIKQSKTQQSRSGKPAGRPPVQGRAIDGLSSDGGFGSFQGQVSPMDFQQGFQSSAPMAPAPQSPGQPGFAMPPQGIQMEAPQQGAAFTMPPPQPMAMPSQDISMGAPQQNAAFTMQSQPIAMPPQGVPQGAPMEAPQQNIAFAAQPQQPVSVPAPQPVAASPEPAMPPAAPQFSFTLSTPGGNVAPAPQPAVAPPEPVTPPAAPQFSFTLSTPGEAAVSSAPEIYQHVAAQTDAGPAGPLPGGNEPGNEPPANDLSPEAAFHELFDGISHDQELSTDFSNLKNMVCQKILQNQTAEPLLPPGRGGPEDIMLAHVANSALEALGQDLANVGAGRLSLHGQELYKVYRCALYRLQSSGLLSDDTVRYLMQEALTKITAQ